MYASQSSHALIRVFADQISSKNLIYEKAFLCFLYIKFLLVINDPHGKTTLHSYTIRIFCIYSNVPDSYRLFRAKYSYTHMQRLGSVSVWT